MFAVEMARAYAVAQRKAAELEAASGVPAPFLFSTYPLASDPEPDPAGEDHGDAAAAGASAGTVMGSVSAQSALHAAFPLQMQMPTAMPHEMRSDEAAGVSPLAAATAAASPSALAGSTSASGSASGGGAASAVLAGLASLASAAAVVDQGKVRSSRTRASPVNDTASSSAGSRLATDSTAVPALAASNTSAGVAGNAPAASACLGPCARCREVSELLRLGVGVAVVVPLQQSAHAATPNDGEFSSGGLHLDADAGATSETATPSAAAGSAAVQLHSRISEIALPEHGAVVVQRYSGERFSDSDLQAAARNALRGATHILASASALAPAAGSVAGAQAQALQDGDPVLDTNMGGKTARDTAAAAQSSSSSSMADTTSGSAPSAGLPRSASLMNMSMSLTVTTAAPMRPALPNLLGLGERPSLPADADTPGSLNLTAPPSGCASATAASGLAGSLALSLGSATAAAVAARVAAAGPRAAAGVYGAAAGVDGRRAPVTVPQLLLPAPGSASAQSMPLDGSAVSSPAALLLPPLAIAPAAALAQQSGVGAIAIPASSSITLPAAAAAITSAGAAASTAEDFDVEAGQLATLAQTGVLSLLAAAVAGLRNRASGCDSAGGAEADAAAQNATGHPVTVAAPSASALQILQEALSLCSGHAASGRPLTSEHSSAAAVSRGVSTGPARPPAASQPRANQLASNDGVSGSEGSAAASDGVAGSDSSSSVLHVASTSAAAGVASVPASAAAPSPSPAAIAQQMLAQMRMHRLMLQRQAAAPASSASSAAPDPTQSINLAESAIGTNAFVAALQANISSSGAELSAFASRAAASISSGSSAAGATSLTVLRPADNVAAATTSTAAMLLAEAPSTTAAAAAASWAARVPPLRKPWTRDAVEAFAAHLLAFSTMPVPGGLAPSASVCAAAGAAPSTADVFAFLRE